MPPLGPPPGRPVAPGRRGPARLRTVAALAVGALAVGLAWAPASLAATATPGTARGARPRPAARVPVGAASVAILALRLSTTSDWTSVDLQGLTVIASRTLAASTGSQLRAVGDGWSLHGAAGDPGIARVEAVVTRQAGVHAIGILVTKGWLGRTSVQVANTDPAGAPVVTRVVDAQHDVGISTNPVDPFVPASRLLGTRDAVLPRADRRRLVLAFYYPWFATYDSPTLADRPADPRSVYAYPGVLSMTEQARAAGVNGFLVSWGGAVNDGEPFELALRAAQATGGVATAYLEVSQATDAAGWTNPWLVMSWLSEALQQASSPAFLRVRGTPVVFVHDMSALGPKVWMAILHLLALRGEHVLLVGDALSPAFDAVEWGVHSYSSADARTPAGLATFDLQTAARAHGPAALGMGAPRLFAADVSPGFNSTALRGDAQPVVPRGPQGAHYLATWSAALAASPDWVVITSWNEWFEDTEIEPGVQTGSLALDQTAREAAVFHALGAAVAPR